MIKKVQSDLLKSLSVSQGDRESQLACLEVEQVCEALQEILRRFFTNWMQLSSLSMIQFVCLLHASVVV